MGNTLFISDLHLGHNNILKFRNELAIHSPNYFDNTKEMDEWVVWGWNKIVSKRDLVWVLGDVVWSPESLPVLGRLNGTKNLILGNHDTQRCNYRDYMEYFSDIHGVWKKYGFVMSHCPIHPNELEYRNWSVNVHGHIHHKEKQDLLGNKYINVNIDIIGNRPVSLDQIRAEIKNKELTRCIDGC